MKHRFVMSSFALALLAGFITPFADGADIFFMLRDEFALSEGDEAQLEIFDERGDTVELWDNNRIQEDEFASLDAADEADLVWVDESVSSGRLSIVQDTTTPLINNENYACDSLGLTIPSGGGRADGHGSPGTLNPDGEELTAGTSFGTDILVVDNSHPIARAAGLQLGPLTVYDDQGLGEEGGGRRSWCIPGESASIIATMPEFSESHPAAATVFVHEAGDELADGRDAEGMRIFMFLSDTNRGPELDDPGAEADGTGPGWEATLLTPEGRRLINAAIDYALGTISLVEGDFNGNGERDVADLDLMAAGMATNDLTFDLDGDGDADIEDRLHWVQNLSNTFFGDADFNGEFNSGDFVTVFVPAKYETDEAATWSEGDWNGDGVFNSGDFVTAFTGGGYESGPREGGLQIVPEPSSAVLVLLGVGVFCVPRRSRGI